MAQALVDLAYYKCGHCFQKFNSVAAFDKHQRERHTPRNAPGSRALKKEEPPVEEQGTQLEPVKEEVVLKPHFEFELKLKLCHKCATSVKITSHKKLQVSLCNACLERNGIFQFSC